MFKGIILSVLVLVSLSANAGISSVRNLNEDWMSAAAKNLGAVSNPMAVGATAYSAAKPYFDVDWSEMDQVSELTSIETAFYYVRDLRYLKNRAGDPFLRRITWLYPDDGCYARAGLMKAELDQVQLPTKRIFIYGDLEVMTENHPAGKVGWWYHTAPIMKTADGQIYVLDAAVEPSQPLKVEDWILRQVPTLDLANISICEGGAYGPGSSCSATADMGGMAKSDISQILDLEWSRQTSLRRDPTQVLGDQPPWSMVSGL